MLLVLVFCIPVDSVFWHYSENGLQMITSRDGWHKYLVDYDASTLDNNTEGAMLKVAATPFPKNTGENVFQYAMRGYTLNQEWNHGMRFVNYEWNGNSYSCDSYERYWHGYIVFLKPLLTFFSYSDIIFLNMAVQFGLIVLLLYVLMRNRQYSLQIVFTFFWIISMQVIIMFSMDYSVCFYIYMLGSLAILLCNKVREKYIYTFLILGMLTSYMDFLTWPVVTLVIPLITLLYMEKEMNVLTSVMASVTWGIGYVGLWIEKWIIGSLILRDSIWKDALERFMMRSSMTVTEGQVKAGFRDTIDVNFSVFNTKGYLVLLVLGFGILFLVQFYRLYKGAKFKKEIWINYMVLSVLPIGWYMVTTNHATIHYWMTWRNAAIFILILFTAGIMSIEEKIG